jgi:hypothetical protein
MAADQHGDHGTGITAGEVVMLVVLVCLMLCFAVAAGLIILTGAS